MAIFPRSFDDGWGVYNKMKGEIMLSSKSDLEFLLDCYKVSDPPLNLFHDLQNAGEGG